MTGNELTAITLLDDHVLETKINNVYTYKEFLLILAKHCPPFQERIHGDRVKKINFLDINNGQGYLSNIYKTTFEFEQNSSPFSVVIKVPTVQNMVVKMDNTVTDNLTGDTHNTECKFYELFQDVNDGFAPQVYYTELKSDARPGFIIMDDLSDRCTGFKSFDSCTIAQFWNVAKVIAHFQAVAACKGKDLSGFTDIFHTLHYHTELLKPMIGMLADYNPKFKEPVERLMKIYSQEFSKYVLIDKPAKYNCLTAVHGDLWANNILFERSKDGSVSDTVLHFIDWQNVFKSNPFFDVARFLITGADAEIRREIQSTLVEKFYEMLCAEYKDLSNGKLKPNFTLEQAYELFDLVFVDQTSVMMVILPIELAKTGRTESPSVLEAKFEKMALRIDLCMKDALEIVEKRKLDGFAERM